MMLAAGVIEVVTSVLILVGFKTRVAAFLASGEMAVAYFMAHAPQSFWPAINKGESAILFCFIFLYLVFAGPGDWSIDRALGGRSEKSVA
jgi:putative oxidoreductase